VAILIDDKTRVVVTGITGYQGQFHTARMLEFGTKVVAGVTPGKGRERVHDVPVFDTIEDAVRQTGANAACVFVPARFAKDSAMEAIAAKLDPVVVITEHIPVLDAIQMVDYANRMRVRIVGPNCPGVTSPGKCRIGIMPSHLFKPGPVGLLSRSGTLAYEIVAALTTAGLGQSTAVGMGGDPVVGMPFIRVLEEFERDPETKAIIMVGEIGGSAEEAAAAYIKEKVTKPVVAYIAGRTAPAGKRMGHAGAVISGTEGTAAGKIATLNAAGVQVAELPRQAAQMIAKLL